MAGYIGNAPVPQATQTRDNFTATAGQTSFATSGYTPGYLDVYLNGVRLDESDYTATNGSDVVLDTGAALDDVVTVVAFQTFEVNAGISLGDNVKAKFGDSDDLQIYHDGSHSRILDQGTGNLKVQAADLELSNTGGYKWFKGVDGAQAELYHNNAKKLATTSTGVDVTGTVTADGLTVDGVTQIGFTTAPTWDTNSYLYSESGYGLHVEGYNQKFSTGVSRTNRMQIDNNGDISFYEDTGTTAKFFWDASAESLGIGTSSPSQALHVNSGSTNEAARFESTDTEVTLELKDTTGTSKIKSRADFRFETGSTPTEAMRIDSSGNVDVYQGNDLTWRYAPSSTIRGSISVDSADNMSFRTGSSNTERLSIDSNGLKFNNDVATNGYDINKIRLWESGNNKYGFGISGSQLNYITDADHVFHEDTTERMRIHSGGTVTMPYQPSFRVHTTASTNVTYSSGDAVEFDTKHFDIGNNFNTTTYRFTAPVTGVYYFYFNLFNNGSNTKRAYMRKNGSSSIGPMAQNGVGNNFTSATIAQLAANDYVEVIINYDSTVIFDASGHTEFMGYLIG